MAKKIEAPVIETPAVEVPAVPSEKDRLLSLYKTLQDLGVRSISDLENLIARS